MVEGALNAASAPNHAWLKKLTSSMQQIMNQAKLKVGKQTFHDLKNPALDVVNIDGSSKDLQQLMAMQNQAAKNKAAAAAASNAEKKAEDERTLAERNRHRGTALRRPTHRSSNP